MMQQKIDCWERTQAASPWWQSGLQPPAVPGCLWGHHGQLYKQTLRAAAPGHDQHRPSPLLPRPRGKLDQLGPSAVIRGSGVGRSGGCARKRSETVLVCLPLLAVTLKAIGEESCTLQGQRKARLVFCDVNESGQPCCFGFEMAIFL